MHRLIYTTLALLCLCNYSIAQNISGQVWYKITKNYSTSGITQHKLNFNRIESFCINTTKSDIYSENLEIIEKKEGTQYNQYIISDNKDSSFYYTSNKEFFFREVYMEDSFYVRDTLNLQWQFKEGNKGIAGFECNQAIINFRGRNYTVWYTTEIPYSFGPWKFNGLPGLILEITEEQGVFKAEVLKVSVSNVESFKSLKPKVEKSYISLTNYFAEKEKLLQEERKIFQSKLPKGVQLSDNCEECNIKLEIIE
jgi:GLPGLI family protein